MAIATYIATYKTAVVYTYHLLMQDAAYVQVSCLSVQRTVSAQQLPAKGQAVPALPQKVTGLLICDKAWRGLYGRSGS